MREQIEILASLQTVDREIREKGVAKGVMLAEIHKREEEMQLKRSGVELLAAEWREKDKLRQEKEQVLQVESRKTMEKRMRMNRIKNIKELQALQREIDQIKQSNAQLEEELIKVLEDLEASAVSLKEKETELSRLEQDWSEKRADLEAQLIEIEQAVAQAAAQRQSIAARVNGDLIQRYELIFSRRGGTAVVAVSDGICQGCFMNIRPQLLNEIIKSEKINVCPSCQRILFYKPVVPDDKQL